MNHWNWTLSCLGGIWQGFEGHSRAGEKVLFINLLGARVWRLGENGEDGSHVQVSENLILTWRIYCSLHVWDNKNEHVANRWVYNFPQIYIHLLTTICIGYKLWKHIARALQSRLQAIWSSVRAKPLMGHILSLSTSALIYHACTSWVWPDPVVPIFLKEAMECDGKTRQWGFLMETRCHSETIRVPPVGNCI